MKSIPEWFIGGPLHGEDRCVKFPGMQQFAYQAEPESAYDAISDNPIYEPETWMYTRQRFTIGARIIVMWVDLNRTSREYAATLLADLLLAPHESTGPNSPVRYGSPASKCVRPPGTIGSKTDAEMLAEAIQAENADKNGEPA